MCARVAVYSDQMDEIRVVQKTDVAGNVGGQQFECLITPTTSNYHLVSRRRCF